jgi:hypothetical protein
MSARAIIEMWRKQHADRVDPLRFHFIDALEKRAASHGGEARRILDERLSALLKTYARDVAGVGKHVPTEDGPFVPNGPAQGPLGALVAHMAADAATRQESLIANHPASSFPELTVLHAFRKTWSRIRSEGQLRTSLQHVPANAGPLNSSALVHRSIALMRELSPGYLQHFLSYVDDLSWMELIGSAMTSTKDGPRIARSKSTRAKPRA